MCPDAWKKKYSSLSSIVDFYFLFEFFCGQKIHTMMANRVVLNSELITMPTMNLILNH